MKILEKNKQNKKEYKGEMSTGFEEVFVMKRELAKVRLHPKHEIYSKHGWERMKLLRENISDFMFNLSNKILQHMYICEFDSIRDFKEHDDQVSRDLVYLFLNDVHYLGKRDIPGELGNIVTLMDHTGTLDFFAKRKWMRYIYGMPIKDYERWFFGSSSLKMLDSVNIHFVLWEGRPYLINIDKNKPFREYYDMKRWRTPRSELIRV